VRFVVHSRDIKRTTQNSGICSPGEKEGEMYYGQLEEILEFAYSQFKVVLFRVKWFDLSNKNRRVQRFTTRNNMTQILACSYAFEDQPYILATQAKQVFYLEDPARRPLHWKVVQEVNHNTTWDVIVVEDDDDVIHGNNSSDLQLSANLNDLELETLNIDGESTLVEAPPPIIPVDDDDDFIDDEDDDPYDLVDSDNEVANNSDDEVDATNVVYDSDCDCAD
jgi:hypothetical protein